MTISLLFSVTIYNIAAHEVNERLGQLQLKLERAAGEPLQLALPERLRYEALRSAQQEAANHNLLIQLVYINVLVLAGGGAGAYFLARRTLQPLEASHEAQTRFVSDASHELKTPLTAMRTEIEVALRDENLSTAEAKQQLISNLEEVNKLTNLSATLLQLAQLDNTELEKEALSLNAVVRQIIEKYDPAGKRIVFNATKRESTIYAHRASTEELITILVDNALKYSPANATVAVATHQAAKGVKFTITNAGDGIAAKDLPHIFDRFYRADAARTKNKQVTGYGLGLSLAKRIVQHHNGELWATSAPQHDTTFTVILPRPSSKS